MALLNMIVFYKAKLFYRWVLVQANFHDPYSMRSNKLTSKNIINSITGISMYIFHIINVWFNR